MRHIAVTATLIAGLALALPAEAADKITLLLDWFVNPDHAALVIAKQKGLFEKHGLEVSFIEPADPSMPPRLVAAGQGDIAVTYQPNYTLDIAAGLPIQRIGTAVATPLNSVMTLADGPIKSLADLKGKTVGYSVSGYETALLGAMLESAGLKLDDVKLVNVNFALVQPLLSGQVDAVVGAYRNVEFYEMQLADHPAKLFFPEEHGLPPYDEMIFVTRQDKAKAPFVQKFLDAVEEAELSILNDPDGAWSTFAAAYPKLDDKLNRLSWGATIPRLAADPAATDPGRYEALAEFMKRRGLIDKVEPLTRYIGP